MPRKTKTVKKTAKTTAPVIVNETHECHCGGACACGCHHGKFKKFIILLIVFLLGFVVAKIAFCPCHHHRHHMRDMNPVFVNGCLDMESVKCPKMREKLDEIDTDKNDCISESEFRAAKREMRRKMREERDDD